MAAEAEEALGAAISAPMAAEAEEPVAAEPAISAPMAAGVAGADFLDEPEQLEIELLLTPLLRRRLCRRDHDLRWALLGSAASTGTGGVNGTGASAGRAFGGGGGFGGSGGGGANGCRARNIARPRTGGDRDGVRHLRRPLPWAPMAACCC